MAETDDVEAATAMLSKVLIEAAQIALAYPLERRLPVAKLLRGMAARTDGSEHAAKLQEAAALLEKGSEP